MKKFLKWGAGIIVVLTLIAFVFNIFGFRAWTMSPWKKAIPKVVKSCADYGDKGLTNACSATCKLATKNKEACPALFHEKIVLGTCGSQKNVPETVSCVFAVLAQNGIEVANAKIGEPLQPGDTLFEAIGRTEGNTVKIASDTKYIAGTVTKISGDTNYIRGKADAIDLTTTDTHKDLANFVEQTGITPPATGKKTAVAPAESFAQQMGITPPAPSRKIALNPPPPGAGVVNVAAGGGASCTSLKNAFNKANKGIRKEDELALCNAADAIMVAYDTRRDELDCLGRADIETVRYRLGVCEQNKIIVASWRKGTFSYKCDKKGVPGDICNAISKPLKSLKQAAPYIGLCASLGDCREFLFDNMLGLNQFAPDQPSSGGGSIGGGGNGPVQPSPHVTDGSPGNGQDGAGYSGTVAGTTGNQNYSNASVGLTQVNAYVGTPPAMTNGAVDLKGQLVQGKSGTPTFTAMGKTGVSAVIINTADDQVGALGGSNGILGD